MSKSPKVRASETAAAQPAKAGKAKTPPKAKKASSKEAAVAKAEDPAEKDGVQQPKPPSAPKPAVDKAEPRQPAKASGGGDDPAMVKRLEEMTDFQLRAYQMSTARISRDTTHVKSAAAKATLPLIEAEVARRKISPGRAPSGVREAVASPKLGKKRD